MCVTSNTAGAHAVDGLCESATALYATALREGRVARSDLVAAPCLVRRALVHPDPNDDRWMLPLPAPAALTRLLIPFAREVSDHLSDAAALLDTLLPFASLAPPPSDPTITVIHGNDRIMDSLREASRAARSEVLTAQPGGNRMVTNLRAGWRTRRPSSRRADACATSTSIRCATAGASPPIWTTWARSTWKYARWSRRSTA